MRNEGAAGAGVFQSFGPYCLQHEYCSTVHGDRLTLDLLQIMRLGLVENMACKRTGLTR